MLVLGLVAEWLMRRSYQQRNDVRFGNLVDGLNLVEREFDELKKQLARAAQSEQHPAAPVASPRPAQHVAAPPPAPQPRADVTIRGLTPTVPAASPPVTTPVP